jgi:O-antigen ligase
MNKYRYGSRNAGEIQQSHRFLYALFYALSFVLFGRPQDIFPFLTQLRPALILSALTLATVLVSNPQIVSRTVLQNTQVKLYLYLVCLSVLGIPFAYHRGIAFSFVFQTYLSCVIYFFLFVVLVKSERILMNVIFVMCCGIFSYLIFSFEGGISVRERLIVGDMFDPNDLSFIIVSVLPFCFLFIKKAAMYRKLISIFTITMGICIILMSGSRGGFVGLVVIMSMILFSRIYTITQLQKAVIILLCLAGVVYKSSSIDFNRFETLLNPQDDYNMTDEWGRKEIWSIGIGLMLAHPLTGVGVSCFDMAIGQYREDRGMIPKWQTAHNSLIQIGTETGVIGFVLFGILSWNAVKIARRVLSSSRSVGLIKIGEMAWIGCMGHLITAMFLSQAYSVYWAFYIALSAVLLNLARREEEEMKVGEARLVMAAAVTSH